MVKLRAFLVLFIATASAGSAIAAPAAKEPPARPSARGSVLADHIPQLDGPIVLTAGPLGRTWATWSYRASGEFDIAVSSRDANASSWSAPTFFGRRNGSDETDPAMVVDSRGAAYIAFSTTNPPRVAVATLAAGSRDWSESVIVSGADAASSPALRLVGDRLIVAFRTPRGIRMVDLPTFWSGNQVDGIQDGPDGVDPLGIKDAGTLPIGPAPNTH
jgi:hypothetical protein